MNFYSTTITTATTPAELTKTTTTETFVQKVPNQFPSKSCWSEWKRWFLIKTTTAAAWKGNKFKIFTFCLRLICAFDKAKQKQLDCIGFQPFRSVGPYSGTPIGVQRNSNIRNEETALLCNRELFRRSHPSTVLVLGASVWVRLSWGFEGQNRSSHAPLEATRPWKADVSKLSRLRERRIRINDIKRL